MPLKEWVGGCISFSVVSQKLGNSKWEIMRNLKAYETLCYRLTLIIVQKNQISNKEVDDHCLRTSFIHLLVSIFQFLYQAVIYNLILNPF